ncbi:MAG TPA: cation diffusion facilitator family transporter [Burkholderiales bacterium]|jgi:cation diffusion facilitator family transporter|nr:cation diffusion facilitator family transporter [Burkholderiales bacterium]
MGSKKVVYAALAGNLALAVTKFLAAGFTGSSAMWSEGIHSVVDSGNQALLLYGMRRAQRPPDARFPFGYGKEVYFWSFVVALLVFATGAGLSLYEGIQHLRHPAEMQNPLLNYVVLGIAIVLEGAPWLAAYRHFSRMRGERGTVEAVQRAKDPTVIAVLFEDSAALAGLLVAFAGIALYQATGNPMYDAGASIVIGLILAVTATWLAFETKGLLIGESANREVVAEIRRLAERYPEVRKVNEVLTMHMGPEFILANISIDIAGDAPRARAHEIIDELGERIKKADSRVKRVFIESQNTCEADSRMTYAVRN